MGVVDRIWPSALESAKSSPLKDRPDVVYGLLAESWRTLFYGCAEPEACGGDLPGFVGKTLVLRPETIQSFFKHCDAVGRGLESSNVIMMNKARKGTDNQNA